MLSTQYFVKANAKARELAESSLGMFSGGNYNGGFCKNYSFLTYFAYKRISIING